MGYTAPPEVTRVPQEGQSRYPFGQIIHYIQLNAQATHVPEDLALSIAWIESKLRPDAAGDWIDANGKSVAPGSKGAHPRSIGLFQLNREGGLGTGKDINTLVDPYANASIALQHLAATANPGDPGAWAAASQNPSDKATYARLVDQALATKPWEQIDPLAITNPATGGTPSEPFPNFPYPPGPAGKPTATDPNHTGSGLPDLITVDPIVIAQTPLGDITLDMTPILNWGFRILLSLIALFLLVWGVYAISSPVLPSPGTVLKAVGTAAKVAA